MLRRHDDLSPEDRRWLIRHLAELGAVLLVVGLLAGYSVSVTWIWEDNSDDSTDPAISAPHALPVLPLDSLPVAGFEAPPSGVPLLIPVEGVEPEELRDTFDAPRGGGRIHEAIDILAPRGTLVRAAAGGMILRLHRSMAGGRSIYQLSRDSSRIYYYAHLAYYADGIAAGDRVWRGQQLGAVGTSGNAPESTPHLHFAIWVAQDVDHFWDGPAVNSYPLLVP